MPCRWGIVFGATLKDECVSDALPLVPKEKRKFDDLRGCQTKYGRGLQIVFSPHGAHMKAARRVRLTARIYDRPRSFLLRRQSATVNFAAYRYFCCPVWHRSCFGQELTAKKLRNLRSHVTLRIRQRFVAGIKRKTPALKTGPA